MLLMLEAVKVVVWDLVTLLAVDEGVSIVESDWKECDIAERKRDLSARLFDCKEDKRRCVIRANGGGYL